MTYDWARCTKCGGPGCPTCKARAEEEIERMEKEFNAFVADFNELTKVRYEYLKTIEALKEENEELRAQIEVDRDIIEDLERRLADAYSDLEHIKKTSETFQNEFGRLQAEVFDLRAENSVLQADNQSQHTSTSQAEEDKKTIEYLDKHLFSALKELADLKLELECLRPQKIAEGIPPHEFRRDLSTEENREYWANVDKVKEEGATWQQGAVYEPPQASTEQSRREQLAQDIEDYLSWVPGKYTAPENRWEMLRNQPGYPKKLLDRAIECLRGQIVDTNKKGDK
jgi:chromosome segregation ATPase